MDIETLLSPISEQTPSGPDLEYDQEFLALDQAARGKPEQQFGDTIVPAEEPSWPDVRKRAEALFSRSKDLRIAVPLVRAWARMENFIGLAAGLNLVNELLSRFWDSLHPMLDVDDDNDPTMRMNALSGLSDEDFIRELRNLFVVSPCRHGKLSVKDVLIAHNKFAAANETAPSQNEVDGILRASSDENVEQLAAVKSAFEAAQSIYKTLIEHVGSERAPELRSLRDLLKTLSQVTEAASGGNEPVAEGAVESGDATDTTSATVIKVNGEIRSREDAIRMLDKVVDFIERAEPSHPAPLFIRRAQRLMSMTFIELIQELAPDSLGQVKNLTGLDREY